MGFFFFFNNTQNGFFNLYKNIVFFFTFVISLIRFFNKFKFIFFYYYQKLNKNIYKFSNYKRPRYSLKFNYLPPFKRARVMLKFLQKSLIYSNQRTFTNRFIDMF